MQEEIKEIFNYFIKYANVEDNIKIGKLEDYITNLQEENEKLKELCDKYEEEHNTKFNEWVFDKSENERLKIEYRRLADEDAWEIADYKSRNEKAIEYNYELQERYCHSALFDDLVASKIYEITEKQLNILKGDNK